MAKDALPPMVTGPIAEEISPLLEKIGWSKADLGRFLGASRQTASRWAHGHRPMDERKKAAFRFLKNAAEVEDKAEVEDRLPVFPWDFGEWALGLGVKGLACARFGKEVKESSVGGEDLCGEDVRAVRERLGWTQAETAAFFGVTHSTPSKWEGPDPRPGRATLAELIALDYWSRSKEEGELRDLWQKGVSYFMTETVGWEAGIFNPE